MINGIQKYVEMVLERAEIDIQDHYTNIRVVDLDSQPKKQALPNQEAFRRIVDDDDRDRERARDLELLQQNTNKSAVLQHLIIPRD